MQKLQKFEQHINELFMAEKYQEVYNLCIAELKKIPENTKDLSREDEEYIAKVYSVLAEILKMQDPQEALKCMDCAIDFVGNSAKYWIQRGRIKESLSDLQGALGDYSTVINNAPCFEAYGCRGSIRLRAADYEGALDDFRKCMELNPNDIMAKKAFVAIKTALAGKAGIATMTFTKKDGTEVCQYMTDEGIIEIPVTK